MTAKAGPLRLVQVGAGAMGRNWLRTIKQSPEVELVGLVDLDLSVAKTAATDAGFADVMVASDLGSLLQTVAADALVNVTVPPAHHAVTSQALFAGLAVISEKPAAPTVAEALSLAATAEVTGQLLMISQSRRYFRNLTIFKRLVDELHDVGIISCDFFKGPHFGGFREEMAHPLLVDMAIHPFDTARYLLACEPVAVYCDAYNPGWSWFAGAAAASAIFEFGNGARFGYHGSWVSAGLETSWNGQWRASAANGTATWDGDNPPLRQDDSERVVVPSADPSEPEQIAGSLAEFVAALRSGAEPSGEVHSNVLSLAMVEAAVESAETRQRILLADVMERAYRAALASEARAEVATALRSWTSLPGQ